MKYYPGKIVPQSGIYGMYNTNGQKINEVTCVKNERFPPTISSEQYYKLVRATK
ncbi:hypothetical protein [Lonepinella koalarum]|uniref:hypothetical protein n=1 Tax=Lonepinella koalarum TaxID=53417 RepID=UPI003F6DE73F